MVAHTLFCNGDIVHNANNYNHEFVNTLHIKHPEYRPQARWKQDAKILWKHHARLGVPPLMTHWGLFF